jgi:hypothetical protein
MIRKLLNPKIDTYWLARLTVFLVLAVALEGLTHL